MTTTSDNAAVQARKCRIAYGWWLVLGLAGAHRFYLGRIFSAAFQLSLALVAFMMLDRTFWPLYALLGWWLADALLIRLYCSPTAIREDARLNTSNARDLKFLEEQHRSSLQHNDYSKTLEICHEAMLFAEGTLGRHSSLYAHWQAEQGEAQRLKGNPALAVITLNNAIGLQERLQDNAGLCTSLAYLVQAQLAGEHPAMAKPVYRRLLQKQLAAGQTGKPHIQTLLDLAELSESDHQPAETLPLYEEASRLLAQLPADDVELKARVLCGQAETLVALERLQEAQVLYERSVNLLANSPQKAGTWMARCRAGLGQLLWRQGLLPEADRELTMALDIHEKLNPVRPTDASPHLFSADLARNRALSQERAEQIAILKTLIEVCRGRHELPRAEGLQTRLEEIRQLEHPSAQAAGSLTGGFTILAGASGPAAATGFPLTAAGIAPTVEPGHHDHEHAITSIHTLDGAIHAVSRLTGQPARGYATLDGGRLQDHAARSVLVPHPEALDRLFQVRDHLPEGFQAFIGTTRWQDGELHEGEVELVVIQSGDPLEAVRLAGTRGLRQGLDTDQILERLRLWHTVFGLNILSAEADAVGCQLLRLPDDPDAFCQQLRLFSPETAKAYERPETLRNLLAGGPDILQLHWR